MSTAGSASGSATARTVSGAMVGRSPCRLTTTSWRRSGSTRAERLEDAVGAGRVVGPGQHRLAARRLDRRGDLGRLSVATTTRPTPASHGPAPDMDDHRLAGDVGQRLARQAGRGHAGRDEDDRRGRARADRRRAAAQGGEK